MTLKLLHCLCLVLFEGLVLSMPAPTKLVERYVVLALVFCGHSVTVCVVLPRPYLSILAAIFQNGTTSFLSSRVQEESVILR